MALNIKRYVIADMGERSGQLIECPCPLDWKVKDHWVKWEDVEPYIKDKNFTPRKSKAKVSVASRSRNIQSKKCLCETSETGIKNVFYLYVSSRCPYHKQVAVIA